MTEEEIRKAIEFFAACGVAEERIYAEIMRARYLDYYLFLNPTNAEYGVTADDLYKAALATEAEFGPYTGSEEKYPRLYSEALRINPMDFTDVARATDGVRALAAMISERAKAAGQTVLLAGADRYLYMLPWLFYDLSGKRIAVAVKDEARRKELAYLFPRGRILLEGDLAGDTEAYDYIFDFETDGASPLPELFTRLAEGGRMDAVVPVGSVTEEIGRPLADFLRSLHDGTVDGKEFLFLSFGAARAEEVLLGMAVCEAETVRFYDTVRLPSASFAQNGYWEYDVYAWNASPAITAILSANVLSEDHTVGTAFALAAEEELPPGAYTFVPADAVKEYGIAAAMTEEAGVLESRRAVRLKAGDLLVTKEGPEAVTAVADESVVRGAAEDFLVLRPKGNYTAEFLKLYLDGPVGQLFLSTRKAGGNFHIPGEWLLRLPMPRADDEAVARATDLCRGATSRLAEASEAWHKAKRDGVGLMMGRKSE